MKKVLIVLGAVAWLALGVAFLWLNIKHPAPFTPLYWIVFVVVVWLGFPLELMAIMRWVKGRRQS